MNDIELVIRRNDIVLPLMSKRLVILSINGMVRRLLSDIR